MTQTKKIYCVCCSCDVNALLVDGSVIYPHREDLHKLPFWQCPKCSNYVGCHHKTKKKTKNLGVIPTKEIREARIHIHSLLDPLWKSGNIKRGELYNMISKRLGFKYHSADIRSIPEARFVYRILLDIKIKLNK